MVHDYLCTEMVERSHLASVLHSWGTRREKPTLGSFTTFQLCCSCQIQNYGFYSSSLLLKKGLLHHPEVLVNQISRCSHCKVFLLSGKHRIFFFFILLIIYSAWPKLKSVLTKKGHML